MIEILFFDIVSLEECLSACVGTFEVASDQASLIFPSRCEKKGTADRRLRLRVLLYGAPRYVFCRAWVLNRFLLNWTFRFQDPFRMFQLFYNGVEASFVHLSTVGVVTLQSSSPPEQRVEGIGNKQLYRAVTKPPWLSCIQVMAVNMIQFVEKIFRFFASFASALRLKHSKDC